MRVWGLKAIGGQFLPPCASGQNSARLAGAGLVRGIDVGPAGHRIEAPEHVLVDVRLAFDELDRAGAALEKPE